MCLIIRLTVSARDLPLLDLSLESLFVLGLGFAGYGKSLERENGGKAEDLAPMKSSVKQNSRFRTP